MDGELLADQPLSEKLIKKGSLTYLFIFLIAPVGYFIRVIVSNTLSVEDVGLFYSIFGFVTLISMYNDLGLTEALQYFLPKYWIEKKYDNYKTIIYLTLFVQVISGILIAGLIWRGADWLAINHFHSILAKNILRLFCFYFIGINFLQVLSSIYMAFQDVVANNISELSKMWSTLVFTIVFRLTGALTINSFSLGRMTGLGIGLIASIIIFVMKYKKTLQRGSLTRNKSLLKTQFHYAFWVFLGANIGILFNQVDQQMVVNFLGTKQAGYYANFWGIMAIFGMIVGPIFGLFFPIVNELIIKNETKKLMLFQNYLYKYFSIFALAVGGFFIALGPQIASIMFGVKFAYSGTLSVYVGPFLVFNALSLINYFILAGLGKIKERVRVLGIALLINILSNVLLVYVLGYGLTGAVISLIIGWIVLRRLSFRLVNNHLKITFDWMFFVKNTSIIAILSLIAYMAGNRVIVFENFMRYQNIAYLAIILLLYCCIMIAFNFGSIKLLMHEIKLTKR